MNAKINTDGRFNPQKFQSLSKHPALDEIENHGCDDGEFFIHLKSDYEFGPNGYGNKGTYCASSIKEAREWLNNIKQLS